MKRGHTTLEYKSKIRKLREVRPEPVACRQTFIVGFPGETDADFDALMNLDRGNRFRPVIFVYLQRSSRVRRLPALPMTCQSRSRRNGLQILQARINQQAMDISRAMVGSTQRIACS